ncbi:MAG: WYL domain-containing protein [Treponema sp.]|nr:WYL domain-containing protein [Treponema sp.]
MAENDSSREKSTPQKQTDTRQSNKQNYRLYRLDALFSSGRYYSKKELVQELDNISDATLYRDIEVLRSMYKAPLEYTQKGWHYKNRLFKLPAVFIPEEDMPSYSMVVKLFELFKETPLYIPLLELVDAFKYPIQTCLLGDQLNFQEGELPAKQWFETRIVIANQMTEAVDSNVWTDILSALQNNRKLQFSYETVEENKVSRDRIIEPWQLIYGNGQWYLWGRANSGANSNEWQPKRFIVARMKDIKLLETVPPFVLPADEKLWNINKHAKGNFGVATSDVAEEYRFIFQGSALYYAESKFADDKKIEPYTGPVPHKEGALLVAFTSNQGPGILKNFLPFGADIIPLAPESFVNKWKATVSRMAEYLDHL